jgi:hypothetical protein
MVPDIMGAIEHVCHKGSALYSYSEVSQFESRFRYLFSWVYSVRADKLQNNVCTSRDGLVSHGPRSRSFCEATRRCSASQGRDCWLCACVQVGPASPQPSVDRLSVTFAPEERSVCSDSSVRMNASPPACNRDKEHFTREPTATGSWHCLSSVSVSI